MHDVQQGDLRQAFPEASTSNRHRVSKSRKGLAGLLRAIRPGVVSIVKSLQAQVETRSYNPRLQSWHYGRTSSDECAFRKHRADLEGMVSDRGTLLFGLAAAPLLCLWTVRGCKAASFLHLSLIAPRGSVPYIWMPGSCLWRGVASSAVQRDWLSLIPIRKMQDMPVICF